MEPKRMMDRLEAVFDIVPTAKSIADIGTDHGYLAVELITRGKAERVIAGDVHKGPLESAKQYIASRGLQDKIDCRLGDGLKVTKQGELNGAICCGMGGFLMRDIIEAGPEPLEFYVLQPQNGQAELRQYMIARGYCIVREILMKDMGKLYTAFLAVRNNVLDRENPYKSLPSDSILWSVGALLAEEKPPLWTEYIDYLIYQRQCAIDGMGNELAHTEKYKTLAIEIDELNAIK